MRFKTDLDNRERQQVGEYSLNNFVINCTYLFLLKSDSDAQQKYLYHIFYASLRKSP